MINQSPDRKFKPTSLQKSAKKYHLAPAGIWKDDEAGKQAERTRSRRQSIFVFFCSTRRYASLTFRHDVPEGIALRQPVILPKPAVR